jgi:hypothetical protein
MESIHINIMEIDSISDAFFWHAARPRAAARVRPDHPDPD